MELTVMATLSVSLSAPPVPVLPWSFVTICRLAAPLKLAVGAKLSPFRQRCEANLALKTGLLRLVEATKEARFLPAATDATQFGKESGYGSQEAKVWRGETRFFHPP
jgi:hypothetical protein